MNVEEVPRGLRVLTVFKGSPAAKGGLKPGDEIIAVNGTSLRGTSSEQATTRIKGKAGTEVTLTVVTGKEEPREVTLKRARVDVPVVESRMIRSGDQKVAYVKLASFTSGAHGAVGKAVREQLGKGAKSVVLDLRDNGGGLLNEAVLVSSIFIPEGKIVTTRGRSRPERVFEATGASISTKIPVAVLVNDQSASASEIVTGALQDRDRATVVGTRTFGKGVFQEIKQLSNGGALDITVGEYFTPSGRNLGGGGPKKGAGIDARRQGERQREDQARRGARRRGQDRDARARVSAAHPVVAVLEKRGRFFTATPFFARGRRINLDKPPREVRAGDLVLVTPTGSRGGHGKVARRLGRPDNARDVLEALMLDRGLRRRFDPAVERAARNAAEQPPHGDAGARRDLRDLPTFTIDPPTARDFDDAISAERLDDGAIRVWVHIADVSAHVTPGSPVDREAYRRGTSVYVPSKVEPMLPEALSNQACSLVPGQDRLAVSVELELEGPKVRRTAFTRSTDPLRRAAGLPAGRPHLRRPRSAPRRRGRRRSRRRGRRRPRSRRSARPAARSRSSRSSPSSTSRTRATSPGSRPASRRSPTA